MSWENLFKTYANNKGADQPAHPQSTLVAYPKDMFSRDEAQMNLKHEQHKSNKITKYLSLVQRKPVFRVFDQIRLKPAYSAIKTN